MAEVEELEHELAEIRQELAMIRKSLYAAVVHAHRSG